MFVGVARVELFIPASGSLKDKRRVLRSVSQTVRNRFNAAVAEVAYQDLWQRASLGISCVAESPGHCNKMLNEIYKAIGRAAIDGAEIVDQTSAVFSLEDLT